MIVCVFLERKGGRDERRKRRGCRTLPMRRRAPRPRFSTALFSGMKHMGAVVVVVGGGRGWRWVSSSSALSTSEVFFFFPFPLLSSPLLQSALQLLRYQGCLGLSSFIKGSGVSESLWCFLSRGASTLLQRVHEGERMYPPLGSTGWWEPAERNEMRNENSASSICNAFIYKPSEKKHLPKKHLISNVEKTMESRNMSWNSCIGHYYQTNTCILAHIFGFHGFLNIADKKLGFF